MWGVHMNKKDLNKMKKELKLDSSLLKIKEIYNVYIKKDGNCPLFSKFNYFEMMDSEAQELYIVNFKKVLGGSLNTKLFELNFNNEVEENSSQQALCKMLNEEYEDNNAFGEEIVSKLLNNYSYEKDVVITFIKGEYWTGKKISKDYILEGEDDIVSSLPFIIGSVNKVEPIKKTLMFNFEEKEFKPSNILDISVNLETPLNGFLFPSFEDGISDVNKLMFYNSKPKEINYSLIENVLQCSMKLTAEEEKLCFVEIIKDMSGESVKPEVIESIYSKINEIKINSDESENPILNLKEMKEILKTANIDDYEKLESVYESQCGKDYGFSIDNILPDYKSKSLKVWNENLSITMNPKKLNGIRQVKGKDGTKCLLIELDDDILVDGFKLKTEEL
jgi:hypothetical protein